MMSIVKMFGNINTYIDQYEDARSGQWFLVANPVYPITICLMYIYMVKIVGPRLMANKKPFESKFVLIIYNIYQVIFNSWLFYQFATAGWLRGDWNYKCQPMDYSENPRSFQMAKACWWFYISKYVDFLDTIFFILRKKDSQVTKLHVIHHSIVPISCWFGVKFSPGGHGTLCSFLNSFVHIVMYAYYLLAALGPNVQKYLWWKKYITTIQMLQFVVLVVHTSLLFISDCDYPRVPCYVVLFNAVVFLALFSEFYKDTYNKKHLINSKSSGRHGFISEIVIQNNKQKVM